MTFDFILLWVIAAIVALVYSTFVVVRNWRAYSLPIRLIPLDVLTVILLLDLNIKSNKSITIADPLMKIEAIAFTGLLTFVLFAPVVWKAAFDRKRTRKQ
jgi:hypothetical protein